MRVAKDILQRIAKPFRRGATAADASADLFISSDVRAVVEGGCLVVLHVGQGFMFKANATGARVWQGLTNKRPRSVIARDLSQEFGVPQQVAEQDVERFIAELEAHGLVDRGELVR